MVIADGREKPKGSLVVLGVGGELPEEPLGWVPRKELHWVESADIIAGGERVLELCSGYSAEKVTLQQKVGEAIGQLIELAMGGKKVVVLASGDPLFFGIGALINSRLKKEIAKNIDLHKGSDIYYNIIPSVSSLQLLAAAAGLSWGDLPVVSLHGRSIAGFAQKVAARDRLVVLTDPENNPSKIAGYLLDWGFYPDEFDLVVGEDLGGKGEKVDRFSLGDLARESRDFSSMSILLLERKAPAVRWSIGIDDNEFACRKPDRGLITRREIRVLSLSALNLHEKSVVWDIGTCTGSVAIEASMIARDGKVFAIEKNIEDLENCRQNMKKFRTDFTLVHGKAPDHLEGFENPDAVFIGGSGGNLESILEHVFGRLNKGGRVVVNAVTLETTGVVHRYANKKGLKIDITQVQVSRSKPILEQTRLEALNPVTMMVLYEGG